MNVRANLLRGVGAVVAYGGLASFLYLIGNQLYHWIREGQWMHVGITDGLRVSLLRCCVKDGDTGRLATFLHWLDTPLDWVGLHKLLDTTPASVGLFLISVIGNFMFIYGNDLIREKKRGIQVTVSAG
jgi:hypothetical protein